MDKMNEQEITPIDITKLTIQELNDLIDSSRMQLNKLQHQLDIMRIEYLM